jgi:ubiquinone/menaquinone biosynthesis C-methylase UbiE
MADINSIKEWYNQKHLKGGDLTWRPYEAYPVFLKFLRPATGTKLLDVGCGTGFFLKAAAETGIKTYGVDLSTEAVKISRKNSPSSTILEVNSESLPFPNAYFDYVCCLGALEHFIDIDKGLKEFIRVSLPTAKLLIVVPNLNYIYWKFKKTVGTEQQEISEKLYSLKHWQELFESHGLTIIKIYQDQWGFKKIFATKSRNIIELFLKCLCRCFYFLIPLRYTEQFIFVMKRNTA